MRPLLVAGALGLLALMARDVRADTGEPAPQLAPPPPPPPPPSPRPPPPPYEPSAYEPPRAAPPAYDGTPLARPAPVGRRGFQMAIRTGASIPMGLADSRALGDPSVPAARAPLGDVVGWQVPVILDIGGKPNPHVFIGGYLGFGFGQPTGALGRILRRDARLRREHLPDRAQIDYAVAPDSWVNPWVGYGLGFSWLDAGDSPNEVTLHGFDFAHVMAGVDFRLSRALGIGPFVDYSLGVYTSRNVEGPAGTFADGDIHGRTLHEWLTIGPRFVFYP